MLIFLFKTLLYKGYYFFLNTKSIGNIGEAKVLCKFIELGIPVYVPFGDNEKADLIAEFNGKLNKIQVKTSIKSKDGAVIFDLTSSTAHRKNGVRHVYTNQEVDYFACYNIELDKVFLIDINEAPKNAIKLRFTKPKNNQIKTIRYIDDYLLENVLNKIINK